MMEPFCILSFFVMRSFLISNSTVCDAFAPRARYYSVGHRRMPRHSLPRLQSGLIPDFFSSSGSQFRKKSVLESGTEAALILGDNKRQDLFKKDVSKKFPMIPPAVLDVCMDALSASFESVAPSDFKKALKPGGMDKVRPKMEATVVQTLKTQKVIENVPLSDKDKTKLLKYIVGISLDYLLKDAKAALMDPALKLQALQREQDAVRRYMTLPQLWWYRLRFFPVESLALATLIAWASYLTLQQYKNTTLILSLSSIISHLRVAGGVILSQLLQIVTAIFDGSKPFASVKRWKH